MNLDVAALRAQVPGLHRSIRGQPLVYLDHAATAHRPQPVLDALHHANTHLNANVHRGVHTVSAEATAAFEATRTRVAAFLGADREEIVFTRGTTEALNLAAHGIAATRLRPRSRILLTPFEHHANLVPWQLVADPRGARVEALPVTPTLDLDLDRTHTALRAGHVAVLGLPLVSNVLGTRTPVAELAAMAHDVGALVVVDAAQAAAHGPLNVHALGADILAFSGHKLGGPGGIGVLWAKRSLLATWPPWQGGGDMIERVSFDSTTFRAPPARFEAGTPPIAAAIGLHAALDWLENIGWEAISEHEHLLRDHLLAVLDALPFVERLPGTPAIPLAAFNVRGVHPHDVGTLLDDHGIAVRTGRHCTDPLHTHLGLDASVRASASFLTTTDELDHLGRALHAVAEVFGVH
jgi:cysteine desulfurase/selenocysteine lyase